MYIKYKTLFLSYVVKTCLLLLKNILCLSKQPNENTVEPLISKQSNTNYAEFQLCLTLLLKFHSRDLVMLNFTIKISL